MDKILNNEYLWLSNLNSFNDLDEGDLAGNDENLFGLCFSALYSENLPMWYLYGGITGQGARITFKKAAFNKWLKSLEFVLLLTDTQEVKEYKPLFVKSHDVIYASLEEEKNICRLKYNGGVNKNLSVEEYGKLKEMHKGFIKALPWFYEKEFRILVRVDDEIAGQLNSQNSQIKLAVKLGSYNNFDVMLGPESVITDYSSYHGFTKFLSAKIQKSSFSKVKMDLLKRNKESIVDDISQWYDEKFSENICRYIHSKNNCTNSKQEDNK